MSQEVRNRVIHHIETIRKASLSENRKHREGLKRIRILVIGESPPIKGKYFYSYDEKRKINTHYKTKASSQVFRAFSLEDVSNKIAFQFLRDEGFYLMDLCDYPIAFLLHKIRAQLIDTRLDSFFKSEFKRVKSLLATDCEKILFLPAGTLKALRREGILEKVVETIGQDVKITHFSGLEKELRRTWYFAYGSNMNPDDLGEWCKEKGYPMIKFKSSRRAVLEDLDLVFNYCSSRRKGGAANIESCPDGIVEGVLFEAAENDMALVDEKEGYPDYYTKIPVTVKLDDGAQIGNVTTYTVREDRKLSIFVPPTREYKRIIVDGAVAHGLSEKWLKKLKAIPTKD